MPTQGRRLPGTNDYRTHRRSRSKRHSREGQGSNCSRLHQSSLARGADLGMIGEEEQGTGRLAGFETG